MSRCSDQITYDASFEQGKVFGSITCPKCNIKVLYGLEGTRPKYCPTCEKSEYNKIIQSLHFSKLTKEQAHKYVMDELRSPIKSIVRKTIQEMVSDD
jgi:uncharacterized Zn finger protein (UPF0148 family)